MDQPAHTPPVLAHMVFFTLTDGTYANRLKLVESAQKYLTDHPGVTYFSVGMRVPDLSRPVNDLEFDVALHMIFASRMDHDAYQVHERHQAFIAENKDTWQRVRVFDSYL